MNKNNAFDVTPVTRRRMRIKTQSSMQTISDIQTPRSNTIGKPVDDSKAETTTICGGATATKVVKCAAASETKRPCGGGVKTIDGGSMDFIGFPRQANCKQRVSS